MFVRKYKRGKTQMPSSLLGKFGVAPPFRQALTAHEMRDIMTNTVVYVHLSEHCSGMLNDYWKFVFDCVCWFFCG